ncbi:MAG: porin [Pirellulales bacterium]
MKIPTLAIGFAMAGVAFAGTVAAQDFSARLSQPASVTQTSFEPDGYSPDAYTGYVADEASKSPSDKPAEPTKSEVAPPPAADAPATQESCPESCDECGPFGYGLLGCRKPGNPWTVPQPCLFQNLGINVGGWIEQGITFNGEHPADRFNGPVATNDRADEYQLNQGWVYFVRPVNTGGDGWDIGGRFDMLYGTDWRFGKTPGLEDEINSENSLYGLCFPQLYMEVGYNDLTVKMGHYATNFGYEQVPAVANFFYSHSYAMAYTEPLLVTGLQAEYKLTDRWTIIGGFNRGWMMFEDFNSKLDFLGGLKWASDEKWTQISFNVTTGPQDPVGDSNLFAYSLVWNQKLSERWTYVAQHNLGNGNDANPRTGGDAQWFGLNQYLFYTINPCWSAGMRVEWLRDANGAAVKGVGNWIGSDRGWQGGPGFDGDWSELTLGLNWRPNANITVRPEARWDWFNGTNDIHGEQPFDDGNSNHQFLFATDVIVTF